MAQPEKVTCETGNVYEWTRPPRTIHWRHGRIAGKFEKRRKELLENKLPEETFNDLGLRLLESLSPDEAEKLKAYIDDLHRAALGADFDVDSMPESDYWELYARAAYMNPQQTVETKEGEMSVADIETFPQKPELSPVRADVSDVPAERGAEDGAALSTVG